MTLQTESLLFTAGGLSPLALTSPRMSTNPLFKGWTHLELGAGNYGEEGYTKTTVGVTLLAKPISLQDPERFFDTLPDSDSINPEKQYAILFETLDKLVETKGAEGLFHVNDFCPNYAEFAVRHLKNYAQEKHYNLVQIESIPGDYTLIDPQKTLGSYGKTRYSSVHLKNPEASFYAESLAGEEFYVSEAGFIKTRSTLQKLANFSEQGLYFFVYFNINTTTWEAEHINSFYLKTKEWNPVPYFFPNGKKMEEEEYVWFIESEADKTPRCF